MVWIAQRERERDGCMRCEEVNETKRRRIHIVRFSISSKYSLLIRTIAMGKQQH